MNLEIVLIHFVNSESIIQEKKMNKIVQIVPRDVKFVLVLLKKNVSCALTKKEERKIVLKDIIQNQILNVTYNIRKIIFKVHSFIINVSEFIVCTDSDLCIPCDSSGQSIRYCGRETKMCEVNQYSLFNKLVQLKKLYFDNSNL